MLYSVTHRTRFRYDFPVRFARCNLRLRPIDWDGQRLLSHELEVTPYASVSPPRMAGYPAFISRLVVDRPAKELVIESRAHLVVERALPEVLPGDPTVEQVARAMPADRAFDAQAPANYLFPSAMIPLDRTIADWCAEELRADRGVVEAGLALAQRIRKEFRYDGEATTADTSPAEAFAARHGVCQDFAQIMIAGCRAAGLPAAYVSGYLRTLPPPGKPRLVGADATHAWVLLWCGAERGWIGLDPTNGCFMAGDHIVTAIGRDYADVSPVDGIFMGRDGQKIDVAVDVEPLEDVLA